MKRVYPPLTIKLVTQAFVCAELCLFILWASLPSCYSHHLAGWLPSQTGADSSFPVNKSVVTARVMDTAQIFPQLTRGFLGEWEGPWVDGSQSSSRKAQ